MSGRLLDFLRTRWLSAELLWTVAALVLAALVVQITGTGVDILALMTLGAAIVLFDHAYGDKFTDVVGPTFWSVALVALALLGGWGIVKKNGAADRFFRSAQRAGYETLYYDSSLKKEIDLPQSAASVSTASTSGAGDSDAVPGASRPQGGDIATPAGLRTSGAPPLLTVPTLRPWREAKKEVLLRIEAPEIAATGSTITIRARLTTEGQPIQGASVAVTADDRLIGQIQTDEHGTASTSFSARAPGQYQLRAHFSGTAELQKTSAAAVLHIIPGRE